MSANPPSPPKIQLSPEVLMTVENILVFGLSAAFPAATPVIGMSDAAIKALVPYVVMAINGHQFTLADLKAMQTELNSFGPSFPHAPGYGSSFGGTQPAGSGAAGQPSSTGGAPTSATITLKTGQKITITAENIAALMAVLGALPPG
jgi:hypothetical protein